MSTPADRRAGAALRIVTDGEALREALTGRRHAGATVALVPTMGNLHAGHLALVRQAATLCDVVIVSIFVNPLQFGDGEDFEHYPRTFEQDCEALSALGIDVMLFAPPLAEIYPLGEGRAVRVTVPELSDILCGEHRPSHFTGVATVVTKFMNLVRPDVAVFGEKDLQQLRIVERLVADLRLPARIVAGSIVREDDGLALSSRNRYLDPAERRRAPLLYRELRRVAEAVRAGSRDFAGLEGASAARLRDAGFSPDYVSIRRDADLAAPGRHDTALAVLAAAWLGRARLIDNVRFTVPVANPGP